MPKTDWVADVRSLLRREHGKGWRIEEQSSRIKLCLAIPGQRKQAVTTHLSWAPSSATKLTSLLGEVRERMDSLSLGLADAYNLLAQVPDAGPGQLDWVEVSKRYEHHRISSGVAQTNYDRNERTRIGNVLNLLALPKRAPHDGRSLMTSYALKYLAALPPGGSGRHRHLLDVSRFLRFAVKNCGADRQWLPLEGEDYELLKGLRDDPTEAKVPIKPEQLHSLLVSLDDNPELRLAVALVGLYGLRPSELMVLQVDDGRLYVGHVKRNRATARNPKPPRLVTPLDLKELPGEGSRVLRLYSSGLVKLPTAIRNAKDFKACGAYFRQYLDRHPHWQSLVKATPGLTPYSLRHGFAWRGVKYEAYAKPVPLRDLAKAMGHNPTTHMRHYGAWTSDAEMEQSLLSAVGELARAS